MIMRIRKKSHKEVKVKIPKTAQYRLVINYKVDFNNKTGLESGASPSLKNKFHWTEISLILS